MLPRWETLAEVEAAIAEEKAALAAHLARLARRRARGLDASVAEFQVRAARDRLAHLREHRRWLLARGARAKG